MARRATIFTISLVITLLILYVGDGVSKDNLHRRMVQYNLASRREDGAPNRVIMDGKPGYIGETDVFLKYLEDGDIKLTGYNSQGYKAWKFLSEFQLEPGTYVMRGMTDVDENLITFQLRINDDTGFYQYLYQHDEDIFFKVERSTQATLHIMVYPFAKGINVVARPAVYRDE